MKIPDLKSNCKDVMTEVVSPLQMWKALEMDAVCRERGTQKLRSTACMAVNQRRRTEMTVF